MKAFVASVLIGIGFAACGGKVTIVDEDAAVTDTKPTSTATDAPSPTMTTPPACPAYRPLKMIPCMTGLSCFYPCAPGFDTSIRATCPGGTWVIETVAACDPSM